MTSTVVRMGRGSRGESSVAFQFEDVSEQARRRLDEANAEAAQILAAAQNEADAIRRRAEEEGIAAARQAVEATVRERVERGVAAEIEAMAPVWAEIAEGLRAAKADWLANWQKAAVRVAGGIAQKIVRRQLDRQPEITVDLIREALELAAGSQRLRILLNPADHARWAKRAEALLQQFSGAAKATIAADRQITPGGCRIETEHGVIDQQVEWQLARITEELSD